MVFEIYRKQLNFYFLNIPVVQSYYIIRANLLGQNDFIYIEFTEILLKPSAKILFLVVYYSLSHVPYLAGFVSLLNFICSAISHNVYATHEAARFMGANVCAVIIYHYRLIKVKPPIPFMKYMVQVYL
jgi:hypothetical protein